MQNTSEQERQSPSQPTHPSFLFPHLSLSSIPQYVSASITYSVVSDTATHLHFLPYDLLAVHTSKSKDIDYWAQEEHTHFLFSSSSISLSLSFFHTFWLLTLKKSLFKKQTRAFELKMSSVWQLCVWSIYVYYGNSQWWINTHFLWCEGRGKLWQVLEWLQPLNSYSFFELLIDETVEYHFLQNITAE